MLLYIIYIRIYISIPSKNKANKLIELKFLRLINFFMQCAERRKLL